jgi:hypothetical protein
VTQLARPLAVALLAVALLVGTALLGVGAVLHPVLAGDGAAQLRIIADTPYWRPLHLLMLAGSGLVIVGIWVRVLLGRAGAAPPMLAALAVIAIGLTLNALNTAFMAGSGWHMAAMFRAGHTDMSAVFDATHPIGLMIARFGNFLVALGALVLGWAERQDAASPPWLATLAWIAALGGFVGVLFFDEASRAMLGAVALLSAWQVATALRALRGAGVATGAAGVPAR